MLVVFAKIGGTPVKIRQGRVMNVPPPATAFKAPPRPAAQNSSANAIRSAVVISGIVIVAPGVQDFIAVVGSAGDGSVSVTESGF